jgi:hypothetical protein
VDLRTVAQFMMIPLILIRKPLRKSKLDLKLLDVIATLKMGRVVTVKNIKFDNGKEHRYLIAYWPYGAAQWSWVLFFLGVDK